ncbi:MAG: hypothetical protein CVV39_08870 [Planctomycetes bacterium HGW-Planctomycetes-1]|nr:MAG: hypothetical protein CVV39_08870 [Planctomycetes bacterium HGW-Planctomycetes-1]
MSRQENYVIRKVAKRDVLMDAEDYHNPKIKNATLILTKDGHIYARDKKTRKTKSLARIIMNAKRGQVVDHRDRNPLNNQKSNLRIATHRQNMLNRVLKNSTGFIGVHTRKNKKGEKIYCASYISEKKRHSFYSPATPYGLVVAAAARDKFILQNGDEEYAPLNFEIFKKEPYKSLLLGGDLYEIRKEEVRK